MQKPLFFIPFILVYKIVFAILKALYKIFVYFFKGFVWSSFFIYKLLFGFIKTNKSNKKTETQNTLSDKKQEKVESIKQNVENKVLDETINENISPKEEKIKIPVLEKEEIIVPKDIDKTLKKLLSSKLKIQKQIRKANKKKLKQALEEEKTKKQEKDRKLRLEREKNRKKRENDSYINKDVDIKGPSLNKKFSNFIFKIKEIPKKIKEKVNNLSIIKQRRNEKLIKGEALLINFDGKDAEKSEVKLLYEYVAKDKEGKVIKGYFEAFSKVEVHSYLLSEGYEVYSIKTNKWIQFMRGNSSVNYTKVKTKDLIFFLTQLSTYLKAGITLVEALRILARQFSKTGKYKKIFDGIVYDLTTGENFSEALAKQNVAFPRLLINMVKTSEMTGELPEVLDDMAEYYTQTDKVRKQMVTALMYPTLVLVFAIAVIVFILIYVIPQFVAIYETMDASQIPAFTRWVISVSDFLKSNYIAISIVVVVLIVLMVFAYKQIKLFRTTCQWIAMHIPVFGETIIYKEVSTFTKTFSSLLSHNVFITDSMEILNKITDNEIYKMIILDTITNLAKGEKISTAFEGHWAFPVPAYEMLVTGEKTGELAEMMGKVASYYQTLHEEAVARIKTFIEPFLTIFLTGIVGVIILAVIIPMFSMYQTIQDYG